MKYLGILDKSRNERISQLYAIVVSFPSYTVTAGTLPTEQILKEIL